MELPVLSNLYYDIYEEIAPQIGVKGVVYYGLLDMMELNIWFEVLTPALDHTHVFTYEVTEYPTRSSEGILLGRCGCGQEIIVKIPALNEDDYESSITTQPTETKQGIKTYTLVDKTYGEITATEQIPSLSHQHEYIYTVTVAPTETTQGTMVGTCNCGEVTTVTLPCFNDDDYSYVIQEYPEDEKDGVGLYTLNDSQYGNVSVTVSIPALVHEHHYQVQVLYYPSYYRWGRLLVTCECGDEFIIDLPCIPDSDLYDVTVISESTETTHGTERYTLKNSQYDGFSFDVMLPLVQNIIPHSHEYEFVSGKNETCSEDGIMDHYKCTICGALSWGYGPGYPIYLEEEVIWGAYGHSYDDYEILIYPSETKPGMVRLYCDRCGCTKDIDIPALNKRIYDYEGTPATETEDGEESWSLSRTRIYDCADFYYKDIPPNEINFINRIPALNHQHHLVYWAP